MWLSFLPPILQELRPYGTASHSTPWFWLLLILAFSCIFCLGCCCGALLRILWVYVCSLSFCGVGGDGRRLDRGHFAVLSLCQYFAAKPTEDTSAANHFGNSCAACASFCSDRALRNCSSAEDPVDIFRWRIFCMAGRASSGGTPNPQEIHCLVDASRGRGTLPPLLLTNSDPEWRAVCYVIKTRTNGFYCGRPFLAGSDRCAGSATGRRGGPGRCTLGGFECLQKVGGLPRDAGGCDQFPLARRCWPTHLGICRSGLGGVSTKPS